MRAMTKIEKCWHCHKMRVCGEIGHAHYSFPYPALCSKCHEKWIKYFGTPENLHSSMNWREEFEFWLNREVERVKVIYT